MTTDDSERADLAAAAKELWERRSSLAEYTRRDLRPVEVLLLVRYREAFARRVLEIGCGGGRVSGYLVELAEQYAGVDIAPEMVDYCRRTYPQGAFAVGDLRALDGYADGAFDVIFPTFNVIDVLDHQTRERTLDALRRMLASGGLLVLSTHNRASAVHGPRLRTHDPAHLVVDLLRLPGQLRNRWRLLPAERETPDYAIRNDGAHGYRGLHYYVTRDAGARQLRAHGFEVLECLDLDGHAMDPGAAAPDSPELHFVARRPS